MDDLRWEKLTGSAVSPSGRPTRDAATVDAGLVEQWVDVLGDQPRDGEAPLAMLPVWSMPGHRPTVTESRWAGAGRALIDLLAESGMSGLLATDLSQTYDRRVRVGEAIRRVDMIEAISAEKTTVVGTGRFVSYLETYIDSAGARVGTQRMRILYFRPAEPASRSMRTSSAAPAVGEPVHTLPLTVTPTLVVAGALATRDFERVHHDEGYARAVGLPGIVVNILTHVGFCVRLVEEWSAAHRPGWSVHRVDLRLAAPAVDGDDLTYALTLPDDLNDGEVAINAASPRAQHLSGTAVLGEGVVTAHP